MKISVIIPAHNAGSTIVETLDSILRQVRRPDEVIVVNDGSDDNTEQLARMHFLKPVVISTPWRGAAAAVNTGILHSKNELLAFLDADDLWESDKLTLQEKKIKQEETVSIILTHMEAFICKSVATETAGSLHFKQGKQPGYLLGTMLCRYHVFDKTGLMDETLKTGYYIDWLDRARNAGEVVCILPDVLMKRRVRPGTLGQRTVNESAGLSREFVEIARRSILRKRSKDGK